MKNDKKNRLFPQISVTTSRGAMFYIVVANIGKIAIFKKTSRYKLFKKIVTFSLQKIATRKKLLFFERLPKFRRCLLYWCKHHSELFKLFFSKCFGGDVCNFLRHGTMSQLNSLGLYMISNQMVLCIDMFGSIMEPGILGQLYCRSIVH